MTQRAFILGSVSFIIYIIVLFNGLPEFLILTWLLISLLVSSAGVALLSLQGLRCDWRVTRALTSESVEADEATESPARDSYARPDNGAQPNDNDEAQPGRASLPGAIASENGSGSARSAVRDATGVAFSQTGSWHPAQSMTASAASAAAHNGSSPGHSLFAAAAPPGSNSPPASGSAAGAASVGTAASPGPAIEVRLGNSGTLNKAGILLDVRLRHRGDGQRVTRRFLVEALPSGASIVATLTLSGLPRGRYHVEELRFIGSDVLGLFRASMRVAGPSSHPDRSAQPPQEVRRRVEDGLRALAGPLRVASGALLGAVGGGAAGGALGYVVGGLMRDSHSGSSAGGAVGTMFGVLFGALVVGDHLRGQMRRRADKQARERDRRKDGEGTFRQVLVGPATLMAQNSPASRTAVTGDDAIFSPLSGRSDEMRGTRPYVAGDDLRTVHWKSTARLGRLVVKEFHPPARLQCAVVWDGAAWDIALPPDAAPDKNSNGKARRGSTAPTAAMNGAVVAGSGLANGALANGAEQRQSTASGAASGDSETPTRDADEPVAEAFAAATEDGLRLAASLCRGLTAQGRPCTLLRLDRAAMCVAAGSGAPGAHGLPSAPAPDAATFAARCAETLADARADRDTPLSHTLKAHLHRLGQGGRVYLVTASLSPDAADAVRALMQRGLSVTVALVVVPQATPSPRDQHMPRRAAQLKELKARLTSRNGSQRAPGAQSTSGETDDPDSGGDKFADRSVPHSHEQQAESLTQAGARVVLLPARVEAETGDGAASSGGAGSSGARWRADKSSRGASPLSFATQHSSAPVTLAASRPWENVRVALARLLETSGSALPPNTAAHDAAQQRQNVFSAAFAARRP